MGFPHLYVSWIKCLSTSTYSIKINGSHARFFECKKGIRKGDPLSPYVFVICMEVIAKMLDKAFSAGQISYHPLCKKIGLTRLCFTDDLIIFSEASAQSLMGICAVLSEFYSLSAS